MNKYLLCCDLDRTLIPNGLAPESHNVRTMFRAIVQLEQLSLTYVSGRDKRLLLDAINKHELPVPDFAIGDVGTTLFEIAGTEWSNNQDWQDHIAQDWHGHDAGTIIDYLAQVSELELQEAEKQNEFKVSYYLPTGSTSKSIVDSVENILSGKNIKFNLIYSVDEIKNIGLLDILPQRASKVHAVEYLIEHFNFDKNSTVFAGDSGNDIPVLISDIPSVLVNNAHDSIKKEARELAAKNGTSDKLYIAQGDFNSLNGNYAAGVIEGLLHYHPELTELIQPLLAD